jgi:hypothetical protein
MYLRSIKVSKLVCNYSFYERKSAYAFCFMVPLSIKISKYQLNRSSWHTFTEEMLFCVTTEIGIR